MANPYTSGLDGSLGWGPQTIAALDAAYDKGNTVYSVKDYGALGDGTTDDTAHIQSAITAASATNGTVFFPPGIYSLATFTGTSIANRALTLTAGITIQGASAATSVLKIAGTVTSFFTVFGATDTSVDLSGLTVRDLGFNMNTTAIAASSSQVSNLDYRAAVVVYKGSRISFLRNRIFDSCGVWGFTVNSATSTDVVIEGNAFDWATSAVYHDTSAIYTSASRVFVRGNRFTATAGTPLAFSAIETHGDDHVITDNVISGWYRGANVTGVGVVSTNIVFAHNTIHQCAIGVELWSTAGTLTGGYGLVNTSINDNEIDIDYDIWPTATIVGPHAGVMLNLSSNYGVKNLDIRNNQIHWRPITATLVNNDLSSSGVSFYRAVVPIPMTGSASAGSANTITTTTNIATSLAAYTVTITAGTGSGQTRTIASNTTGANAVITTSTNWTTNPDATSVFSTTSPSTGTASAGAASTITTTLAPTGSLAGYTIRIASGTGSGQERIIASNTTGANSVITVSSAWTVTPDNTSVYVLLIADQGVTISGNKIYGPAGPGVYVQPKSVASQVRIDNNTITNPASNAATYPTTTYRAGVKVDGLVGSSYEYRDIDITRNQIVDNRGTALVTAGVALAALTVPITNGLVSDNVLRVADGTTVPLLTSSATAGSDFRRGMSIGYTSGAYYGPQGTRSAFATTLNQMTAVPFQVTTSHKFDRLGAEVTVLGATSVVRLGIYADNGFGQPGDLVLDGGTINGASATAQEVTIAQWLQPGTYWLAGCIQTAACTLRIVSGALPPVAGSTLAGGTASTAPNGYYSSSITGAFPSQFSVTGTTTGANLVVIRAT